MMSDALVPCECCARHIRSSEGVCPFCETARTPSVLAMSEGPGRLSRAAVLLGVSMGIASCQSTPTPLNQPSPTRVDAATARLNPNAPARPPQDNGNMAEVYGAPPRVATDAASAAASDATAAPQRQLAPGEFMPGPADPRVMYQGHPERMHLPGTAAPTAPRNGGRAR